MTPEEFKNLTEFDFQRAEIEWDEERAARGLCPGEHEDALRELDAILEGRTK